MPRVLLNLAVSGGWQPLDPWENEHWIRNADRVDGICVNEIQVEAGVENLRDDSISQQLWHRFVNAHASRCRGITFRAESSPRVIIGQQQSHIIGRLALPEREADALKVC